MPVFAVLGSSDADHGRVENRSVSDGLRAAACQDVVGVSVRARELPGAPEGSLGDCIGYGRPDGCLTEIVEEDNRFAVLNARSPGVFRMDGHRRGNGAVYILELGVGVLRNGTADEEKSALAQGTGDK